MSFQEVFGTTAGFPQPGRNRKRSPGTIAVPALTIIYHPDLHRIGDRVCLHELSAGREVPVSRERPAFARPGAFDSKALHDPYISREPLIISRPEPGQFDISAAGSRIQLRVGGRPVTETVTVMENELIDGVVLELSSRVVLLFHGFQEVPEEEDDALGLIGDSAELIRVRSEIRRIADLNVPVLIRGETGTGKELVALAIHNHGPRSQNAFVGVNMGAIQASLAGAELFGNVKGAFTGAIQDRKGYFRAAHHGTLFLDEVGETPVEIQVMLLRVLETREVMPVGTQQTVSVDVRLIAATDADLEGQVRSGTFRGPLLHRLSSYEIWLPSLRRRRDDIGRLLAFFLRRELSELGESRRLVLKDPLDNPWIPAEVVAALTRYDWPGNVRELQNVVRQLVIDNRGYHEMQMSAKLRNLVNEAENMVSPPWGRIEGPPEIVQTEVRKPAIVAQNRVKRRKPADVSEEELILALRTNRWELQATAAALGISRPSLYLLVKNSAEVKLAGDLSLEDIRKAHDACNGSLDKMVEHLEVSRNALKRRLKELGL